MKNALKFLILAVVAAGAGYKLHVDAVELAIGSRYEGCHEVTLWHYRQGQDEMARNTEALCVWRDKSVREFVK